MTTSGALEGVRVVELASMLMAPYATQWLGDLGADVIKVESDVLDTGRRLGGGGHPELSSVALNLHRNKRSVRLDLADRADRRVLDDLLDTADVFVTNLRPGALRRRGLGPDDVRAGRPGLIYCESHGFRTDGDEAERPAFDDIIQAETGVTTLAGDVGFVPMVLADKVVGQTIAMAVLAALVHRGRTGEGQRVEVPMFDSFLAFTLVEHLALATTGEGPAGYTRILGDHRGPHRTADGHLAVMPFTDAHWKALFEAAGRGAELDDDRFATQHRRLEAATETYAALASVLRTRTTAEWLAVCDAHDVPAAVPKTLDAIVQDAATHRGLLPIEHHDAVGPYRRIGPPVIYERTPMDPGRPAPLVGEHTDEIRAELGRGRS